MSKTTKIILLLVMSLISIGISLLMYFGIDRYVKLQFDSSEKYIQNYSKLNKGDEKERVIVSFSTTPDRIEKIKPMIKSLLDQTVKVDQIAMNIPETKNYKIPEEYSKILNIFKTGKDYGECEKIIPTLLREGENGTKIIYVNDNIIYGKDFIETMIEESNKEPNFCIENKSSFLVKPEFFKPEVVEYEKDIYDDKWIKKNLNVSNKVIKYSENYKIF